MPNDIKNNNTDRKLFFRYLNIIFCFFLFSILGIALINFKMDPEKIYSNYFKSKSIPLVDFTEKLVQSDNGLVMKNYAWNERDIFYTLAKHPTDAECAILGSSPATQISSFRPNKSLSKICSSLINLSLNGGALEDYIVLSGSIVENKSPPKTIIISINPWTLNFNRDSRWLHYKTNFLNMMNKITYNSDSISKSSEKTESYNLKLIKNLIDLEYFKSSIDLLMSKNNLSIEFANKFDFNLGSNHAVLLPDGSRAHSNEYIKSMRKFKVDEISGNQNYKIISGKWYSQNAVKIFTQLVLHLKKNFNVVFVMTPYHPEVWNFSEQPVVNAMKIVEPIVHEIAKLVKVQVIGSFNPKKISCTDEEFYDEMHPKDLCLSKLENVYLSY